MLVINSVLRSIFREKKVNSKADGSLDPSAGILSSSKVSIRDGEYT